MKVLITTSTAWYGINTRVRPAYLARILPRLSTSTYTFVRIEVVILRGALTFLNYWNLYALQTRKGSKESVKWSICTNRRIGQVHILGVQAICLLACHKHPIPAGWPCLPPGHPQALGPRSSCITGGKADKSVTIVAASLNGTDAFPLSWVLGGVALIHICTAHTRG